LNYDDKCLDTVYRTKAVSQPAANATAGYNGLSNTTDANGNGGQFCIQWRVMVWSVGTDKNADHKAFAPSTTQQRQRHQLEIDP